MGSQLDLQSLRQRYRVSARGSTVQSLVEIADRMGMMARPMNVAFVDLDKIALPAILHWDGSHFVVLERVDKGRALIHDPATGTKWWALDAFSQHYSSIAIEVSASPNFDRTEVSRKLRLRDLWTEIRGLKTAILKILILSFVVQAYVAISPYLMQVSIDSIIPSSDFGLLLVLCIAYALLSLVNAGATLLRDWSLSATGLSLGFDLSRNVGHHLFRLPLDWFGVRHVGDVLSRFQAINAVQRTLTRGGAAIVLDASLVIVSLAMMLFYDVPLALIAMAAVALYAVIRGASQTKLNSETRESITHRAAEQSMMIETIRGIATFRLFGREAVRHSLWQNKLADAVNAEIRTENVNNLQQALSALVFGLENILVIYLSVAAVINGEMTVGMVFAFMAYKAQFSTRARALVEQGSQLFMLPLHLERLSDIALAQEDVGFRNVPAVARTFEGALRIRNVEYRYSSNDRPILRGVNLDIAPGSHVAITGSSGGGKSTLVRLILGLAEPTAGSIEIDGIALETFGHVAYRSQVGAVLQDDHLFSGSILRNIALFDDNPDYEAARQAAKAASIDEEILEFPMQYETLVGDMGSALSGGQRQRILIARALYRKPRLLVIDEGTSNLDARNEAHINEAIKRAGITRLIIAHRWETLKQAEVVYQLRDGRLEIDGTEEVSNPSEDMRSL